MVSLSVGFPDRGDRWQGRGGRGAVPSPVLNTTFRKLRARM